MNFTTHLAFGILVGGLFFGTPEIMLLVGLGSAIPDLDREYGFLSKDSFRRRQVHRAVCHNFLFIGMLYLINPYLALGAFLHSLLDSLTSARDRGVEWLYPFSRLVRRAVYDYDGKRVELDPKQKIYFVQNEVPSLIEKTTHDLKPSDRPRPWRRTYGPALSGRLLDQGIGIGCVALTLLLILLSTFGYQHVIDIRYHDPGPGFVLPMIFGAVGIIMNFIVGEIDRKKLSMKLNFKLDKTYSATFLFSVGLMIFAIIIGAIMNQQVVNSTISKMPFIAAGAALVFLISFIMLKIYSSRPLSSGDNREPPIV
jgi:LexA-binding, inner membrane-associated putative hydrolase